MNFEHQDRARRKTGLLVVLLVAAVVCLIAIAILCVGFFLYFLQRSSTSIAAINARQETLIEHFWQLLQSLITAWIALAVIIVVGAGCLYKYFQLGNSGHRVAESLGARVIDSNARDPLKRRVLNIVEEMAIALLAATSHAGNNTEPFTALNKGLSVLGFDTFAKSRLPELS